MLVRPRARSATHRAPWHDRVLMGWLGILVGEVRVFADRRQPDAKVKQERCVTNAAFLDR